MNCTNGQEVVRIKKYPNRRYYDTARSRHITLNEIHDLIRQGHDVCVTDSRSRSDITNAVLFQIVLEKGQPKVDLFPTSILHWMIRTDRSGMQESLERFFEPFTGMLSASRKQVEDFWRGAIGGQVTNPMANPMANPMGNPMAGPMTSPMAWASSMVQAMQPKSQPTSKPHDTHDANASYGADDTHDAPDVGEPGDTDDTATPCCEAGTDGEIPPEAAAPAAPTEPATPDAGIEELRRQIRELTERIDHVQGRDATDRP